MFRLGLVCLVVLSVEEAFVQGGGGGGDGGGCVVCKDAQNEAHCAQIGEYKECKGSSGSSSGGGRGSWCIEESTTSSGGQVVTFSRRCSSGGKGICKNGGYSRSKRCVAASGGEDEPPSFIM